jgi:BirA family biotin operon repressor/biotin-[acetyl-CoA-carboxylase] ligase
MAGVRPGIKWVNDIFLGGRKLSGILTEGAFADDGESFSYAVVGIGVNLHKTEFPDELSTVATDLETECGKRIDIAEFAIRLAELLSSFEAAKSNEYIEEYRKRTFIIGREVTVRSPDGDYPATVVGIDPEAKLMVRDKSNNMISLYTGEVSIKI